MPFRKSEASTELLNAVQAVEDRADECYKLLRLLHRPANEARWALLTAMALNLEITLQKDGPNGSLHRIRVINFDHCTSGFRFINEHGRPASRLVQKYTWNGSLIADANHALMVTDQYMHFLNTFPMWHKDHEEVEMLPDGKVRFYIPRDAPRQRQVIAFQQGFRTRGSALFINWGAPSKHESKEGKRMLDELFHASRQRGLARKFSYEPSRELIEALRPQYQARLDDNFRHRDDFQLNGYSLREFKELYVALLILCAIHEYICYPFDRFGHPIPVSSLVMVKSRRMWVNELSKISKIDKALCEKILGDLTLNPSTQKGASMCIHPFVPLDDFTLAVAPQFPLASAVDDNILRMFSYTFDALFSAQNTEKERTMIERLRPAVSRFEFEPSIELPDGTTEIDVVLADEVSSTLVLAELKWSRKPNRPLERIDREKEIEKGVQQLKLIRSFSRKDPNFLEQRKKLPKSISDYTNVHYLLVSWDYWHWIEPEDGIAIVDFTALLAALNKGADLDATIKKLLTYDWLPVEGRDFKVRPAMSSTNGASIETMLFTPT
ncbi:hypothetical protein RBB76_01780 [Tunturiibacter psychrotolerans]|uniref:hypothetical protein n=1 Tax=Tunturiibacter psychrotolerans TaxID=3069686 RepID=UPI003D9B07EC